jgi:hypothetical protein
MVKSARDKHEARVLEVQQELGDAITKCDALEQTVKEQAAELTSSATVEKEA